MQGTYVYQLHNEMVHGVHVCRGEVSMLLHTVEAKPAPPQLTAEGHNGPLHSLKKDVKAEYLAT